MSGIKAWSRAAGVRAVKTAAQTAVAIIPTSGVMLGEVDWVMVVSTAALSAVLSLLTSIAGIPEVANGEPVPELVKDSE